MIRLRIHAVLLVALLLSACAARHFEEANDDLTELQIKVRQGANGEVRSQLGELARDALGAARRANGQLVDAVAWYRVAAVASAEAGPHGAATLFPSVDEGRMACDRLPQRDASQPRDCGLIRLSLPVGVANDLAHKFEDLGSRRAGGKLPATELPAVVSLYDGFEAQADEVGEIRAGMTAPVVPTALKTTADDYRRFIYCWAIKSYSLAFDVEGATPQALTGLTDRKTALRRRTEGVLGPIHCEQLSGRPALE
jgi:hypothetical protein